ncbi:MAG: hypothetical protein LBC27_07260 [Spirochaetaceae bacterium]|jgi:hypothetical protein|nr:hypothetical protein [Spirochaetaceae bacterium]
MIFFKTIKTFFSGVFLAAAILLPCCCGEEGSIETAAGGSNKPKVRPPPSAEVYLNQLNFYYADDEGEPKTNLMPALSATTGDYTVADAELSHGSITVEAVAQHEKTASILISWENDKRKGAMAEAVTGPAKLEGIAIPDPAVKPQVNTLVTVRVSNAGKTYNYLVTIKAPGADSSLYYIAVVYEEDIGKRSWKPDADGNITTKTLLDGDGKYFNQSRYEYTVELDNKGEDNLIITALANSGNSVVTLTNAEELGATPVEDIDKDYPGEEQPAQSLYNTGGDNDPVSNNNEGLNDGGEPADKPAPVADKDAEYIYWKIPIPNAGSTAVKAMINVTNGEISSNYTITIVPPPDTTAETDSTLMNLQIAETAKGDYLLKDFTPTTTSYSYRVLAGQKQAEIISCAPTYSEAKVTVSIGDAPSFDYAQAGAAQKKFDLPVYGNTLVVKFKVEVKDAIHSREYSVTFDNPKNALTWKGTVALKNNNGQYPYKVSGVSLTTSDGQTFTANVSGENNAWSMSIDEQAANDANPPVSFVVIMGKPENGNADAKLTPYRAVVPPPSTPKSNIAIALSYDVSDNASNPLYLVVYSPNDLANMSANTNYYLANDIDLTTLPNAWDGPNNYQGKFNGNGNTITLAITTARKIDGKNIRTGLFDSLNSGALIENLKVRVSMPNAIRLDGHTMFGALLGGIDVAGTYTFRNISVTGNLWFSSIGNDNYAMIGGILGETNEGVAINLTMENCETDLDIKAELGNNTGHYILSLGSLIGKMANRSGTANIVNCRTGGSIKGSINSSGGGYLIAAGGLIANAVFDDTGSNVILKADGKINLTIQNCYSTTQIEIAQPNINSNMPNGIMTTAGGLVGVMWNQNAVITNSFALNPKVLADSNIRCHSNRIIGNLLLTPKTLNNYALKGMLTGTGSTGTPNTETGVADNAAGLAKDADFFKTKSNWTSAGFTEANWDFSGLSKGLYPALKKKN